MESLANTTHMVEEIKELPIEHLASRCAAGQCYNKILRAYVLIERKSTKLSPEAVGQLNMYLNY